MKKSFVFVGLAMIAGLAIAGLLLANPESAMGQAASASSNEVKVDNFTFSPQTLTVPVNTTVTWTNKDDIPHVIASNDGLFKSKALDTDQKYSFTFSKAGTYAYYCSVHPKMTGKIVVQ